MIGVGGLSGTSRFPIDMEGCQDSMNVRTG